MIAVEGSGFVGTRLFIGCAAIIGHDLKRSTHLRVLGSPRQMGLTARRAADMKHTKLALLPKVTA